MKIPAVLCLLLLGWSRVWAVPATLDELNYKIVLSETMPGVDDAPATLGGPVINVDVTDKLRNSSYRIPLQIYSINGYFLSGDKLNLLCRVTPRTVPRQVFTFLQLNLANNSDSRQFLGVRKTFFSPDHGSLLAVFDQDGKEGLGWIRLQPGPAALAWLYSPAEGKNLFQDALPGMGGPLRLASVVGWSPDFSNAAFVLAADSKKGSRYYLARLILEEDHFFIAAVELDLSAYPLPPGGTIDRVDCSGEEAALYFPPKDLKDPSKVIFKLPRPKEAPKR